MSINFPNTSSLTLRAASGDLTAGEEIAGIECGHYEVAAIFLDITKLTLNESDEEVDFYLQTSYDEGDNYYDLENLHFDVGNDGQTKKKLARFGEKTFTASETAVDLTQGALADGTKVRAPLGGHLRIKTTVTGTPTYAYSARLFLRDRRTGRD